MYKILVTGGSGFIGTNLIDHLSSQGYGILNLDIKTPKVKKHHIFWKQIDICDYDAFNRAIIDFDPEYVIHLAAKTDLNGKSLVEYDANILGVKNLHSIVQKLTKVKRVIIASSMYVCRPGYSPKDYDDYAPHTVYGQSKVETEKIIKSSDALYEWILIRPTSIWGPYFGEPYNLFFKIVLSRKYFHLGSKACKKTYGYIDNFLFQLHALMLAERERVDKKTFYLGDYEPYDISTWADEIAAAKGIKIPHINYSFFKFAAYFGDLLGLLGIKFPMTSFRLKNMTTDNIHDLEPIAKIAPQLPISRKEGTKKTVKWLMLDD